MIDLQSEHVIAIADVPAHLPEHARPALSTVRAWTTNGCRGNRLESVVIGSLRYTSVEALGRFVVATTASDRHAGTRRSAVTA